MRTAHRTAWGFYFAALVFMLYSAAGFAQAPTAIPSQFFAWDEPAPTLADAAAYVYRYYADGAAAGVQLQNVACVNGPTAGTFTCKAPIPAFTPGQHSIQMTAANAAGESAKTAPFAFVFVVTPAAPVAVRIQ